MKRIGQLTDKVIKAFGLEYEAGKEILLSPKRKKHMEKHRDEFADFDGTFERIDEGNVLVAVLLSDKLTVRTMYVIKDTKLENYLKAGRTKKM